MARYIANPKAGQRTAADLFETLGQDIAARYAEAENVMMQRIRDLAKKGLEASPDALERARVLAQLRAEGERIAADLANPTYQAMIINIAAHDGMQAAIARLGLGGRIETTTGITATSAQAIAAIAAELKSNLNNMSARITRYMPDAYQRVISMTSPLVLSGVDTIQQAQRRAVEQFIAQGVTGFTDSSGAQWRIGTYAEMATRTSVNRAWQQANIGNMSANGINLVSIVVGASSCPACASVSGYIYSTDGTPGGDYDIADAIGDGFTSVTVEGDISEASDDGCFHPNCRCVVVAYLAGFPIATGSTYDPQAERDRQELRGLERRVRDLKRSEASSLDDVTEARYGRLIANAQADIRAHVDSTGINRRNYREQLGFSDGKNPTIPAPKPLPIIPAAPPQIGSSLPDKRSTLKAINQ